MRILVAAAVLALAAAPAAAQSVEEIALYQLVRESTNPDELKIYLQTYPSGVFADLVRKRLARVEEAIATAKKKQEEAAAKAAADAAAAEKAKADATARTEADKAGAANATAPSVDEVKATLAAYYTAATYHIAEGGTLNPVWKGVKVGAKEASTLYSTDFTEYQRRGSDLEITRWPVEISVEVEIVENGKKRVEPSIRRIFMYRSAEGAWAWNWRS